jgi:hypothetical protein
MRGLRGSSPESDRAYTLLLIKYSFHKYYVL